MSDFKFRDFYNSEKSQMAIKVLKTGKDLLDTWSTVKDGNILAKGVAAAASAGIILEALEPSDDWWEFVHKRSFRTDNTDSVTRTFVARMLFNSSYAKYEQKFKDDNAIFISWNDEFAGIWDLSEKTWAVGPFPKNGDYKITKRLAYELVWNKYNVHALNAIPTNVSSDGTSSKTYKYSKEYDVIPLEEEHDYIGQPSARDICQKLKERNQNSIGRFILIMGPTGTGKSTLARKIAKELADDAKLLKLSNSFIRSTEDQVILELIDLLDPEVVLLDDVHTIFEDEERVLALLERCHERKMLTIGTYMRDDMLMFESSLLEDGCLYIPGMRPGRVDEVISIFPPDRNKRKEIMTHYLKREPSDEIVDATSGLTPAYLMEFCNRIQNNRYDNWQYELRQIRLFAPKSSYEAEQELTENTESSTELIVDEPSHGLMSRLRAFAWNAWVKFLAIFNAQPK